jgi:muramoyltetrapeptide carboxypeptidase LdcA involved in peptidoglycan recycling
MNPASRSDDLMWAFQEPSISAVVSTIGGDDSNRLLHFLDLEILTRNPKISIGYSDTTVTHLACLKAGLVSFYGPAIMSGFGENGSLFQSGLIGPIPENREGWSSNVWNGRIRTFRTRSGNVNMPRGGGICRDRDLRKVVWWAATSRFWTG